MRQMRDDGVRRALAFFTSAFSSYSGCRQYREDLFNAQQAVGAGRAGGAAAADVLQPSGLRRGERRPRARRARRSCRRRRVHIAFTAHSIPVAMASNCALRGAARARRRGSSPRRSASPTGRSSTRAAAARRRCRGSSPTSATTCATLAERGVRSGRRLADRLRLRPPRGPLRPRRRGDARSPTARADVGARGHRRHASGVRRRSRELIVERLTPGAGRRSAARPSHDVCAPDCCLPARRPSPGTRAAPRAASVIAAQASPAARRARGSDRDDHAGIGSTRSRLQPR